MEKNTTDNTKDNTQKPYKFRVVCRVRPALPRELALQENEKGAKVAILIDRAISVTLSEDKSASLFQFDKIFPPETTAEDFFKNVAQPAVRDLWHGVSNTIMAYGQTGTGKTYSIFGTGAVKGLIPLSGQLLFALANERPAETIKVTCSFYEIYNENLLDLLNPSDNNQLRIREGVDRQIYIEHLSEETITTTAEFDQFVLQGTRNKAIQCTRMSTLSSRSHTIVLLTLHRANSPSSTLTFVDLAGSERAMFTSALGLREAGNINKSLASLKQCMTALASNRQHVPYRDSKLTRLLTASLSGHIKTTLILTCSPHHSAINETLQTLHFGNITYAPRLGAVATKMRTILTPMERGLFAQLPSELVLHTMCFVIGELLTHTQTKWLITLLDKRQLRHMSLKVLWRELIAIEVASRGAFVK